MNDQIDLFAMKTPQEAKDVEQEKAPAKRKYNQNHYERNKSKILAKAKNRYRSKKELQQNVIPLFGGPTGDPNGPEMLLPPPPPPSVKKRSKARWEFNWSTFLLQLLVLAISYFLITETAAFYSLSDQSAFGPLLKALLLDGSVLALSLMKPRSVLSGLIQKLMVVLIYAYTVLVVSGGVWYSASQQRVDHDLNQKASIELEAEMTKAIALRDRYFVENRITRGNRMHQSVLELRQKLAEVRGKLLKIPEPEIIWNNLFTLVAFRILVMISNLCCLAELKRRHRVVNRSY